MNRRRRTFVLGMAAIAASHRIASAQPRSVEKRKAEGGRPFRIGFVANSIPAADLASRSTTHPAPRLLESGLRDRGWIDGRDIEFVWRSMEGRRERLPAIFDELVRMPVDALVVFDSQEQALKRTRDIPIVMSTSLPAQLLVERGLVQSLARPGGNLTGVSMSPGIELIGKKLAILKQAAPATSRVAFFVLAAPGDELGGFSKTTLDAAAALGITVILVRFSLDGLDAAFAEALRRGANAISMPGRAELHWTDAQKAIHALADRHRVPVIHEWLSAAESGGLMAFGIDPDWMYRRMPYYVDRILRGAKAGELPIEQPSEFVLVVNAVAARSIGLTLPDSILVQADRVIR